MSFAALFFSTIRAHHAWMQSELRMQLLQRLLIKHNGHGNPVDNRFLGICRFHPSAACQSISLLILIWLSCFEQRIILISSECVINYTSSRPSILTCNENFILSASFASAFLIPNAVRKRQGEEKTERERQRGKKWKNAPIQCGRAALVRVCPILIYLFVLWIFFSDCRSSCACVLGYLFLIMRCFVHAMRFGGISLFPPAICCCCFHCSWTDIGHCLFSRVLCTELVDDTGEKKIIEKSLSDRIAPNSRQVAVKKSCICTAFCECSQPDRPNWLKRLALKNQPCHVQWHTQTHTHEHLCHCRRPVHFLIYLFELIDLETMCFYFLFFFSHSLCSSRTMANGFYTRFFKRRSTSISVLHRCFRWVFCFILSSIGVFWATIQAMT